LWKFIKSQGDKKLGQKELKRITAELAAGYPDSDKVKIAQEFQYVVTIVLPLLAQRVLRGRKKGLNNISEMWKFIKEDSERLFEGALSQIERVKVIFVVSKFMNNRHIGEMITEQALEIVG
jgi:predicted PP-loop superfamily ATPase